MRGERREGGKKEEGSEGCHNIYEEKKERRRWRNNQEARTRWKEDAVECVEMIKGKRGNRM